MKYRILDEETLGQMVDFLDTIQIEASKGKFKDDMDKINMCSYLISEIINSSEATDVDTEEDIEDIKKGDGLYVDMPDIQDMDEKDWNTMIEQLDAFFAGWEKATNKKKQRNDIKNKNKPNKRSSQPTNNEEEEEEHVPTNQEKFEQFYLERELKKSFKGAKNLNKMLTDLGLQLPPEELN